MIPAHFIAISIGFLLDRIIGDPPNWPHPVRWIGALITKLTTRFNKGENRTLKGAITLILTVLIVFAIVFVIVEFAYSLHILIGIAIESVLIAVGLAQKSLRDAAMDVYKPLVAGEINEAQTKLSWIVGRDTDKLDVSEISRATIETVSENIADGVTSPLFWALLFGAPGLWLYKAVNTLDSMIGYRDERYEKFGKFSARADDILNFIPARMTGLLIIIYAPNRSHLPFLKRFSGWMKDARRHPSPNSGYLEAATAWQLGVSLGGKATYRGRKSERPKLGPALVPLDASHIKASIFELHVISFFFWFIGTILGVLIYAIT